MDIKCIEYYSIPKLLRAIKNQFLIHLILGKLIKEFFLTFMVVM